MKINIIIVDKRAKESLYTPLIDHYKKMSKRFAHIEVIEVFNKNISKAQETSSIEAQKSYTLALEGYLKGAYTIALDPAAQSVDSFAFANLLKDRETINFFIGGAFGFEPSFLSSCDKSISLGTITMTHKLVKVVLLEQIYRGFSIVSHHPYHK
ncbi:MAG: 23S rRNA (pseudouridine(1915)-N(3))-methyltransferase RlmH [Campylobacterales bacterium]|nr:23S rRNA (pseudouridine(1915)-N(3))-methyltransferase RlmH [Campylobacterales bacterium]